jgi:hypothetical protein
MSVAQRRDSVVSHGSQNSSSQPVLTRHTSKSSIQTNQPSGTFFTTTTGVRVRQRSHTRFEALKRDVFASRLVKSRGLAQMSHVGVDPDIVVEVISPALPDQSELKFVEVANHGLKLVVVTRTTLATFSGKRYQAARNGEPISDGVNYTRELVLPLATIQRLHDSSIDEKAIYVHTSVPARMSQRDMESRLFEFANALVRDRFIAHVLELHNTALVEDAAPNGHPPPKAGGPLKTWDSVLRSSDDVRRNLAAETAKANQSAAEPELDDDDKPTTILETSEMDLLRVAENRDALCAKIRAYGDSRVLFSSEAALSDNTHDVVILCDKALYTGKQRKEHKLRNRVPYEAIEAVVVDSTKPQVIIKLDFTKVTLRGDMSIAFPSHRNRDIFVTVIGSAYEACVVDRLPILIEEDIFWAKRGLVESQLLRVYGAVKENRFTRALGRPQSDGPAPEVVRQAKWLIYTLRTATDRFLTALGAAQMPEAEKDFVSRCVFAVFEHSGWTESLLRASIMSTLASDPSGLGNQRPTSNAGPDALIFHEPGSIAGGVVRHYVASCGEQYVQVVFSQIVDTFTTDSDSFNPMHFAAAVEGWAEKFLRPVLANADSQLLADEIKIIIALLHERTLLASNPAVVPSSIASVSFSPEDVGLMRIGKFFFSKLVHPALTTPQAQGLVLVEPTPVQADNLQKIATVLRAVLSRDTACIYDARSPVNGFTGADKDQLAAFCKNHFDAAKDLLKGFIFRDLLREDGLEDPCDRVITVNNRSVVASLSPTPITRFKGSPHDVIGLANFVDTTVDLSSHNPKLLFALSKALIPHSATIFGGLSHCATRAAKGQDAADASSGNATQRATGEGTASVPSQEGPAPRPDLDQTIQQLTHEVLDLRQQLRAAQDDANRSKAQTCRLQEALALGPVTAKRKGVSFAHNAQRKKRGHSSDDSSSSSSSDENDGGDVQSPVRGKNLVSPTSASNPLLMVSSPSAIRVRNGLSPAEQDYRRSVLDLRGGYPGAVPLDSVVFGCPLDTYVVGRGAAASSKLLHTPDPEEDPDL